MRYFILYKGGKLLGNTEAEIQEKLLNFYNKKQTLKNLVITELSKISDGWENEVYSFRIDYDENGRSRSEDLILRIYPGDGSRDKSAKEFKAMKRLHEVGFPVPEVFMLELDESIMGKPFVIMQKINGELMGKILKQAVNESSTEKIRQLTSEFCSIFASLHKLDWRLFVTELPYDTEDPYSFINHTLYNARNNVRHFGKEDMASPLLDWLEERKSDVPCNRLSVMHCDYHIHNIILDSKGSPYVIDWTNFDIGDFRVDLAWTLLLMSTYGSPEAHDVILNEYERIIGSKVNQIEYFEVFAIARRLFSIFISLSEGAEKMGMRPGAEAAMLSNINHIKTVYNLLYEKTGIATKEFEQMIYDLGR